ncbi:MAG: hypothetical protein ABJC62_12360 [Frankiaceae bacterium]
MTTLNGLPAHILLVHAIVVLLPLAGVLLVACAYLPAARRRLAGLNALLSVFVLGLVPVTTNAGEWLQTRVRATDLVRRHAERGDTAVVVALPIAVLALVVWWRERESRSAAAVSTAPVRRTFLAPASAAVGLTIAALSVLAAGAAGIDVYLIGDSGAKATWQGQFTATPNPGSSGGG